MSRICRSNDMRWLLTQQKHLDRLEETEGRALGDPLELNTKQFQVAGEILSSNRNKTLKLRFFASLDEDVP